MSDGKGGVATGTVSVTINSVNDATVANDDTVTCDKDTTTDFDVLKNDTDIDVGDELTISSVGNAQHGSVSIVLNKIRYAPDAGYTGADSFTYTVSDEGGSTATATVNVTISKPTLIDANIDTSAGDFAMRGFQVLFPGTYIIKTGFYKQQCDTKLTPSDIFGNKIAEDDDSGAEPGHSKIEVYLNVGMYNIFVEAKGGGSVYVNLIVEEK